MSGDIIYTPDAPIQYTALSGWVTGVGGRPLTERMPAHRGDPPGPYLSRLRGLPPRTVADWSGLVNGCAVPYNVVVSDGTAFGRELFYRSAFAADDGLELPLLVGHDDDYHVGWITLQNRRDGLHFAGQLNRGGLDTIGNRRDVSIGFIPGVTFNHGTVRRHVSGMITEVSVVPVGSHHGHAYINIVAGQSALAA